MIEYRELEPDFVGAATQMVTESYESDVRRGIRDQDYLDDWTIEAMKIERIANGGKYAGVVGFEKNRPVALSLLADSSAYSVVTGVWEWFYTSPYAAREGGLAQGRVFTDLATETLSRAISRGMEDIVMFIGVANVKLIEAMQKFGLRPYEVELRAPVSGVRKGLLHRAGAGA